MPWLKNVPRLFLCCPQITRFSQHQPAKPAQEQPTAAAGDVPQPGAREPGYVATLKDNYGFITCVSAPVIVRVSGSLSDRDFTNEG